MNYWIFIATQRKIDGETILPDTVLNLRLVDRFWGLGERTPNRRSLKKGDRVVFYKATPSFTFAASAVLASDPYPLNDEQKTFVSHGKAYLRPDFGVKLEEIQEWDNPRLARDLLPSLEFIENKENWGSYFQGGVRQISESDFRIITENIRVTSQPTIKTNDEIVSESQFALEAHLEEFIDKNWAHINFSMQLERYTTDEQNGRQFPAGPWSIDFLCIDKATKEFVVIELKRGKTSDATVGQVLRYMGWVQENLAKPGQQTRGIIIAQDVDDALRYSVKGLKNIEVLTYKVDFKLLPFDPIKSMSKGTNA